MARLDERLAGQLLLAHSKLHANELQENVALQIEHKPAQYLH